VDEDFKLNALIQANYYDLLPPPANSKAINFEVEKQFDGEPGQGDFGELHLYELNLKNLEDKG